MVRFWRRLRHQLIGEQKARQYIIYAVGEILLIVVGILIAFQVNNWDIRKKEERQALELVRNLRSDLMRDTANFQGVIQMYSDNYRNHKWVLEAADFEGLPGDSIMNLVIPIYRTVDYVTPTFRKMESIGLTELAGFGNLFDRVNAYYTTVQNDYLNFRDWDAESSFKEAQYWYYNTDFENYYHEIFIEEPIPPVQSEMERKKELVRLLGTPEVRNLLRTNAFRKKLVLERINATRQFAEELLGSIDSSLTNK